MPSSVVMACIINTSCHFTVACVVSLKDTPFTVPTIAPTLSSYSGKEPYAKAQRTNIVQYLSTKHVEAGAVMFTHILQSPSE